jgi:hypothetical protein
VLVRLMGGLVRVYVPATTADLAVLVGTGRLRPGGAAVGVTPALTAWANSDGPADTEQVELVALSEAARGSLRMIGGHGEPVRVVLVVDVPSELVSAADDDPSSPPGRVRLTVPELAVEMVAAVHLDEPSAAQVVRAAAAAVGAADDGDVDAEAAVAAADDHELLWYAPAELPAVVG